MIQVLLADDHRVLVDGIRKLIQQEPDLEVVGVAHHGEAVLAQLAKVSPNLVMLDINMPGKDGSDICETIVNRHPSVRILVLSMHEDTYHVKMMLDKGAHGYISKSSTHQEMLQAIRIVGKGGKYLSPEAEKALTTPQEPIEPSEIEVFTLKLSRREKEVLRLIVEEYTTQEIADQLYISLKTVESHRRNLLSKLNARNTAGLVRIAVEKGLV